MSALNHHVNEQGYLPPRPFLTSHELASTPSDIPPSMKGLDGTDDEVNVGEMVGVEGGFQQLEG
jgi:hypothetical protein